MDIPLEVDEVAKETDNKERCQKVHTTKPPPVMPTKHDTGMGRVMRKGELLLLKYEVLGLLSQGGFGQVYLARHVHTKTKVAVKAEPTLIRTSLFANERHVHEALASNPHPNFLQYFAEGRTVESRFLVLQLCGPNLRDLKKSAKDQKFSIACSLGLALQIVESLRHLHNIGFVHRDIKPANFCMGLPGPHENTLYLLDFGLSKRHLDYKGNPVPTRPGRRGFRGTPRYASVNILLGKDMGRVDDLWSVFYILTEQIRGVLPWRMVPERDMVTKIKQETDYIKLLCNCPQSYKALWQHITVLEYETQPNYAQIMSDLQKDIVHILGQKKATLDWSQ